MLGMTALGWLAVTQIRRSAGTIYGLGLALFDGLLFPLLVFDFLVYRGINSDFLGSLFVPPLLVLEYFIVRKVWRRCLRPDE